MASLEQQSKSAAEEILYRFPQSHAALELVPDHGGTYRVRLVWLRGKSSRALFESTPLRAIAEVTLRGQTFPVYLSQHSRKRRERILLAGRRKTTKAARSALRFIVSVEGREDRLVWTWRIGATAPAMLAPATSDTPDTVRLRLPFPPSKPKVYSLTVGEGEQALAVWSNDIVTTVVSLTPGLVPQEGTNGLELVASPALLGGEGATLQWETHFTTARSEPDVAAALRQHAATLADKVQSAPQEVKPFLWELSTRATAALMAEERLQKRGLDRLVYRFGEGHVAVGKHTDTAQAACALLGHFYLTGDDALRRTARLLAHGVCDFQVKHEESPHWGAIWDTQLGPDQFASAEGEAVLSTATAARVSKGMQILNAHFQTEILSRTATTAAQWLLLRMDRDGFLQGETFREQGGPLPGGSPWAVGEALIPLVETFRSTGNEMFLKAALRTVGALEEGMQLASLDPETATTAQLAAVIEGVLLTSREYESQRMIALAQGVGELLRGRRLPDGCLADPTQPRERLTATLAGVQGALALTRVDRNPLWLVLALRALRRANALVPDVTKASVAHLASLSTLPLGLLLAVAARANNCIANREKVSVSRNWQTFAPEPAAWEYVEVTTEAGEPVDFLPLVCPVSLQVLVPVVAPAGTEYIRIVKNKRTPLVRNLLTGDMDTRCQLVPLGENRDAMIGVFLADT